MPERDFPLFPLGLVALPSERIPLHIFEDRYRTMITGCLQAGSEFGIVWQSDQGLASVGCACAIEKLLDELEDGRMNIIARGTRPFELLARQEDMPYPAGTVEFSVDEPEEVDHGDRADTTGAYAELVQAATDTEPDPDELAQMNSYAMAGTIDFGAPAKQRLLELRSENARLRLVAQLIRAALKRLDYVDRAQARARSNGKVRFG